MHIPYENIRARKEDFKVSYRFYTKEEGGRQTIPFQGYRSDFWYDHPEHHSSQIFMIWPEFEDADKNVIIDNSIPVPASGTARMWMLDPSMLGYHKNKIRPGLKGFFMEGSRRVAVCEIIEIGALLT